MLFNFRTDPIESIAEYIKKLILKNPPNNNTSITKMSSLSNALPACIILKVCSSGNSEVKANLTPSVDIKIMQLNERINPSNIVAITMYFLTFWGSVTEEYSAENAKISPKGKVNRFQPLSTKKSNPLCSIGFRLLKLTASGVVIKNIKDKEKKNKNINKNKTASLHKTSMPIKLP